MRLRPSLSQNFLLMGGDRLVDEARRLLNAATPRYLVVVTDTDRFVLAARDFEARVAGAAPDAPLAESGLLAGVRPALIRTLAQAGRAADGELSLMMEDGVLAGVIRWRRGGVRTTPDEVRGTWDAGDGSSADVAARFVSATLPQEVFVGERVLLVVELGSRESPYPLALPGGTPLELMVQALKGFVAEEGSGGIVHVPADGATARAEFRLRAVAPGPGVVRVHVLHGGIQLGFLSLDPEVLPAPSGDGARGSFAQPLTRAAVLHAAAVSVQADLSLFIVEERVDGKPVLRIRVSAADAGLGLNQTEFGPVPLQMDPLEFFDDFFADIKALDEEDSAEVVQRRLEAKGAQLFGILFPEPLRARLWELRDRITSVQIHSDEAWIPWELCRLTGRGEGGRIEPGPFFCEAFEVTRWMPRVPLRPRLTLNNMAVVMPGDSGLPYAPDELSFLLSLKDAGRSVREIPARYLDVWDALQSGTYDGFHFSGHGIRRSPDPDRSAILLEKPHKLRPEDLGGVVGNLGLKRPLVFLNACHGARGGISLTDTGGWARRFLLAGAGAFVGAYWRVEDQLACDFAQAFYREVRAGRTLGAAVRAARLAIRTPDDPTWLAYTVYADPAAFVGV
jgi:hypothetical protein